MRGYVGALSANSLALGAQQREQLAHIAWGLDGGVGRRMQVLGMPGFRRQTWLETLLFRVWFLLK